jgi:hypothetical protein
VVSVKRTTPRVLREEETERAVLLNTKKKDGEINQSSKPSETFHRSIADASRGRTEEGEW